MDHFGISHAMMAMVEVYRRGARRTGRTTALVESLKDGDRVLCGDPSSLADLRRRIEVRGLKVEVLLIGGLGDAWRVTQKRATEGRTICDHTFVERHFEQAMKDAGAQLTSFQNMCSQEAERKATEMAQLNRIRFE